jgi:hypothetical protein
MDDAAVPHTVAGDVQWAVGAARSSTPASAGSASAAPAQSPAGNSTNDEHLAAAWGYPALPKGVLSYKDADVALLHHAKKLFEEQLQQLQAEERQLRAGIVPSADAPLVEQPTEPHTPAPSKGLARGAPSSVQFHVPPPPAYLWLENPADAAATSANYDDDSSDSGDALHAFVAAEERQRAAAAGGAPPPAPAPAASASAVQAALLRNLGDSSLLQPGALDLG